MVYFFPRVERNFFQGKNMVCIDEVQLRSYEMFLLDQISLKYNHSKVITEEYQCMTCRNLRASNHAKSFFFQYILLKDFSRL